MANYGNCIEWVLRLEDRTLSGKVANLGDGAGLTRFGITQGAHITSQDFFTCPTAVALQEAKNIYWSKFWIPLQLGHLQSDELAATILSFAVNDGNSRAVKLVQKAVGVPQDGAVGPQTLRALIAADNSSTAARVRDEQLSFYDAVEKAKPADKKFAVGWDRRARAVYPDLPA